MDHRGAALGDGADAELRLGRRADLARHQHVERRAEPVGHHPRHRHPTARQGEHQRVLEVAGQGVGELDAGVGSVAEALLHAASGSGTGSRSRSKATSQSAGCSLWGTFTMRSCSASL